MLAFIVRRILWMIPVLLLVSFATFALLLLLPGDPALAMLGETATPQQIAAVREELGLNQPVPIQYAIWLGNAARGNLGRSISSRQPVGSLVWQALGPTTQLALTATVLAIAVALPVGALAATRRNSGLDTLLSGGAYLGVSMPDFWLGILLIMAFSLGLRWLPPSGYVPPGSDLLMNLQLMLLPAATLAASRTAVLTRQFRSSLIDVMNQPYISTARAKGLRELRVVTGHGIKNAFIPVMTLLGLQVGHLLGGAVVVEVIFAIPGLGRLTVEAIFLKDFPVVQGAVFLIALFALVANLVVDVAYAYLNPRIRFS